MLRKRNWTMVAGALALSMGIAFQAWGSTKEYKVKAAYLFNFAKFIEWPGDAFASGSAPYKLCIVGEDPFGDMLDKAVKGKNVKGRSLEIARFGSGTATSAVGDCHILFISNSESGRLGDFVGGLSGPVATVADAAGFAKSGGAMNFMATGGKLKIELNAGAAQARGLKVSAQLQQITTLVD